MALNVSEMGFFMIFFGKNAISDKQMGMSDNFWNLLVIICYNANSVGEISYARSNYRSFYEPHKNKSN